MPAPCLRHHSVRCPRQFHSLFQFANSRINHRPVFLPGYLCKVSVSSCISVAFPSSHRQHHHIPVSMTVLYEISMTCCCHRILCSKMTMGKNRVSFASLIRSPQIPASSSRDGMFHCGSSLCMYHIIPTVLLIYMRALRPDCMAHSTFPDFFALSRQFHFFQIQLL